MYIRFNLNGRPGYPATRPVPLRIIVRRNGKHFYGRSLPLRIAPKYWTVSKQRVKGTMPGATEVNAALEKLRIKVEAAMLETLNGSNEEVRSAIDAAIGLLTEQEVKAKTVLEWFDVFYSQKSTQVRGSTLQTYSSLRNHLAAFLEARNDPQAQLRVVEPGFLQDFSGHMASSGLNNTTTNRQQRRLRSFLEWLHERGEIEKVPKAKPLPTPKSANLYVTAKELSRLEMLDMNTGSWTQGEKDARDLFLVEASTGQRFSDVVAMEWTHLRGIEPVLNELGTKGTDKSVRTRRPAWTLSTKKAGMATRVPIVGPALRVIQKRSKEGLATPTPRLSNQLTNRYLKKIGKAAGLAEPVTKVKNVGGKRVVDTCPKFEVLSTHMARKTFVTLVLHSGNAPTELLGLTHSDLRTLQRYVGTDEKRRHEQIEKAFM